MASRWSWVPYCKNANAKLAIKTSIWVPNIRKHISQAVSMHGTFSGTALHLPLEGVVIQLNFEITKSPLRRSIAGFQCKRSSERKQRNNFLRCAFTHFNSAS
ncbi:Protein of unknown function [Gryllus bimaculatus]|nr:Protein of unknown function [Gryllus bimaculatus]